MRHRRVTITIAGTVAALAAAAVWGLVVASPNIVIFLDPVPRQREQIELERNLIIVSWLAGTIAAFPLVFSLRPQRGASDWVGLWIVAGVLAAVARFVAGSAYAVLTSGDLFMGVLVVTILTWWLIVIVPLSLGISIPLLLGIRYLLRRWSYPAKR